MHKKQCEDPTPQPPPEKRSIKDFQYLHKIGEGNFSEIFRGQCRFEKKLYAIKYIRKEKMKTLRKEQDVLMERHCLAKLKASPFVVRLHSTF